MDSSLALILSLVITVNPAATCWPNKALSAREKQSHLLVFAVLSGSLFALGSLAGGIFSLLDCWLSQDFRAILRHLHVMRLLTLLLLLGSWLAIERILVTRSL